MKTFTTALYTLFIVLLLSVALVFLATMIPMPGHIAVKIVKSGSMEPAIHVGSIVVIQPRDNYAVGDVITFGADTKTQIPTTHRIVSVDQENGGTVFATKGDANEEPDPTHVALNEVHGKMLLTVPFVGYILDFAKRPLGFSLMIALPAGIIILDEIFRIMSEVQKMWGSRATAGRKRDDDEPQGPIVTMQELRAQVPQRAPHQHIDGIRPNYYRYE